MYFEFLRIEMSDVTQVTKNVNDDFSQKVSKDITFHSKCSFFHSNFDSEVIIFVRKVVILK